MKDKMLKYQRIADDIEHYIVDNKLKQGTNPKEEPVKKLQAKYNHKSA